MNYLAHAFLSFGNPDILAGNMIADFVKGKKIYDFPESIQAGIRLHRAIDEFTDNHEASRQAKKLMYEASGRYSGAFVDIIYDHFLARDIHYFSENSLAVFSKDTYQSMHPFEKIFPGNFQRTFHYMQEYNWLYGYYFKENIDRAFHGIYHRAKFLEDSEAAFSMFENNYNKLRDCYAVFMPDVEKFAVRHLSQLSK